MPAFLLPLLGNKYFWWLAVAIAVVLAYFGWRAHERGIGAAKIIQAAKEAKVKHETTTADQVRKADESLADPSVRDGVRKRYSRD